MLWALSQNDPDNWLLASHQSAMLALIEINDKQFKYNLDRYKYPNRFDLDDGEPYQKLAMIFIIDLQAQLQSNRYLIGDKMSLVDAAIFPFVRQFANDNLL